ncbi:MAG: lipid A export permease/ATP-binding protein MsbA [Gammaproteobacteria bacterium]|mgnify:CR=1 FL=1|jgi:ATP-binding cassette, subfamily B, bacterial MsbA|nr:lipid A export permease/ATP-binding protein MsbA [Gammaproteobacteria bacterium]MBT4132587.1 lipid A export permease/ATP-binding protein MsbA [Candidatus Neomarinimicrobiota bacterium]MBT4605504.1 lipid A export permease/ATP-binding protein MsbA [Thiotrichales bacterium]MBT4328748.1 lipid A export permease/ATP-binding protein MsbA [Gammaproteobacteria bacterium]MBT5747093.1 lipid A export permease/ATP-binding protein MsbA [Gammaproteobacteria bacterium]
MRQSKEHYLRLLKYVRPYRGQFSLAILGMVVFAATEPALPALMQPMLDGSFIEKDETMIVLVPILLILLYLVRGIASFTTTVGLNWVSNRVIMDLRTEMFQRLLNLPNNYYDSHPTGTTISKLTYDVNQVAGASTEVLIILVRDSLSILGLLAWMFYIDWKLSLIIFLTAPIIVMIVRSISSRLRRLNHSLQDHMGSITQILEEAITGQRVIKIFGGEKYENDRFHYAINQVRTFTMKTITTAAINSPVVQLITVTALAAVVYIASVQSANNEITVGEFISFFSAMAMLITPVKRLTGINEILQKGLAAAESVFELVDQVPEASPQSPIALSEVQQIEFNNLSLKYSGNDSNSLHQIQLTIAPNETLALVGQSGSGKSTLVNLLPLFYRPTEGEIRIGNTDITNLSLGELRKNIALVSQDVTLFNDTVAANIAYGSLSGTTIDQVRQAAEKAHALEFIEKLPQGFETIIGERGTRLSGGQRQRIAIARALLKDAPILILDEATSALDSHSEKQIQMALDELVKNRTTLMIAHRLSTIAKADRIIVMDEGKIVEEGTHESLYRLDGVYTHLYDLQFQETS